MEQKSQETRNCAWGAFGGGGTALDGVGPLGGGGLPGAWAWGFPPAVPLLLVGIGALFVAAAAAAAAGPLFGAFGGGGFLAPLPCCLLAMALGCGCGITMRGCGGDITD